MTTQRKKVCDLTNQIYRMFLGHDYILLTLWSSSLVWHKSCGPWQARKVFLQADSHKNKVSEKKSVKIFTE